MLVHRTTEDFAQRQRRLAAAIGLTVDAADVDDRDETLGRKIRDGEKEWIPYLVVIGDRELASGLLSVRIRSPKGQDKFKLDELQQMIHDQMQQMPFRQMMFPNVLSQRPMFLG